MALPTGTLRLAADGVGELDRLCAFAARRNPRRGFLIVSRVLGRHLPARPAAMRASMAALAAPLAGPPLAGPVLFFGMAETATALGQGVHEAWRAATGREDSLYLQSSRQRVPGARLLARFEEGHSHASTHLVQVDPALADRLDAIATLVLVDDECSTGATFVAAARALVGALPNVASVRAASITDWSGGAWLARMPRPSASHAELEGALDWTPAGAESSGASSGGAGNGPAAGGAGGVGPERVALAPASNAPGTAPVDGTPARTGFARYPAPSRTPLDIGAARRWTVLGDGEFSFEALRLAEEIEAAGAVAHVQCITRSPVLPGHAMATVTPLADAYGSGAPCFVHNLLGGAPEAIAVVSERAGDQAHEIAAWLDAHGAGDVPVSLVTCRFGDGAASDARPGTPAGARSDEPTRA